MTDRVVCRLWASLPPSRAARRRAGFGHLTPRPCAQCGAGVALSPSSVRLLEREEAAPICERCASRAILADGRPLFALAPGGNRELDRRRAALADRLGVPIGEVEVWPPATLRTAIDAQERRN